MRCSASIVLSDEVEDKLASSDKARMVLLGVGLTLVMAMLGGNLELWFAFSVECFTILEANSLL